MIGSAKRSVSAGTLSAVLVIGSAQGAAAQGAGKGASSSHHRLSKSHDGR